MRLLPRGCYPQARRPPVPLADCVRKRHSASPPSAAARMPKSAINQALEERGSVGGSGTGVAASVVAGAVVVVSTLPSRPLMNSARAPICAARIASR